MNVQNLHTLIDRYEANYEMLNGPERNEKFKWKALRCFQDVWFSDAARAIPFDQKFKLATKECSFLINGGHAYPVRGVIKMAEQRPEQVASLFENVLFAPYNSLRELQNHVDSFLDQMNVLQQELFPTYNSYRQSARSATCYLMLFAPEKHFIYYSSYVDLFAECTEYEQKIDSDSLPNLYDLCEIVVHALREQTTLLAKYDALFKNDSQYYYDESLHMMAYDLIYCCKTYNFDKGLHPEKVKPVESKAAQKRQQLSLQQQEQQKLIESLNQEIENVQLQLDRLNGDGHSLLGKAVTHKSFGLGQVTAQQANKITVQFGTGKTTTLSLSDKLTNILRFEGDTDLLPRFGAYARLLEQKKNLETKRTNAVNLFKRLEIKQ